MVFLEYRIDPEKKQGRLKVSLSASPTLFLSDLNAELSLTVTLRFEPPSQHEQSITLVTDASVLELFCEEEDGMDIFSKGAFGALRSTDQGAGKSISLGYFHVNGVPKSEALDLRERGYRLVSVPGDGSPVTVTQRLNWARIFKYEEKRTKEDLVPGERFDISINRRRLGTMWWCWGDLASDLMDKKLHVWHDGRFAEAKPDDEFVRRGNWVLGKEPMQLGWEGVTEGGKTSFEVIE